MVTGFTCGALLVYCCVKWQHNRPKAPADSQYEEITVPDPRREVLELKDNVAYEHIKI